MGFGVGFHFFCLETHFTHELPLEVLWLRIRRWMTKKPEVLRPVVYLRPAHEVSSNW